MEATLSVRQEDILSMIRDAKSGISTWRLAQNIDAPEASVRRDIGALRRAGHNIQHGYYGYTLEQPVAVPTVAAESLAGTFSAL